MEEEYGFVPQMQWYDDRNNPYMQGYEAPANMVEQESAPLPEDFEVYPDYDFSDLKTTNNRPVNSDYLNYIYKKLRKAGYDDKHTAVFLGQIAEESGGDPFAVDSTGTYEGLLQWAPDRYQINTFHDDDPYKEINRQLKYLLSTIDNLDDGKSWTHGGEGSGYNSRKEAYADWAQEDDMARMNRGLSFGHIRPTGKQASANSRYKVGSQIYDMISTPVSSPAPDMLAQNTFAEGGDTDTVDKGTDVDKKAAYEALRREYIEAAKTANRSEDSFINLEEEYQNLGRELGRQTLAEHPDLAMAKYRVPGINDMYSAGDLLVDGHVRENTDDAMGVLNWMRSYIQSPGFDRIIDNQNTWWEQRHPKKSLIISSNAAKLKSDMQKAGKEDIKSFIVNVADKRILDSDYNRKRGSVFMLVPQKIMTDKYVISSEEEYNYPTVLGHEIGHIFNPENYTPFRGEREAMDINKGYEKNGHDEKYKERHADILSMKYLLYKTGIYDSREDSEVKEEHIKELRSRFPNIRIFNQMKSDKDVAKMLNLVADAGTSTPKSTLA